MKKVYNKPQIVFEDYSFAFNIAGNCGWKTGLQSEQACIAYTTSTNPDNCVFIDNGYSVFGDVGTCDLQPDDGNWSEVCYHVITDEMRAFSS